MARISESDGTTGIRTKAQIVKYIGGGNSAAASSGPSRAEVGVVRPAGRNPYLRTCAGGQWNNLLSLHRF